MASDLKLEAEMQIKRKDMPRMTIEEFSDANNLVMTVRERRVAIGDPMRYCAHFDKCEVGGDGYLRAMNGNGATPEDAISDYAGRITLRLLVVGAHTPERREIKVPRLISKLI